MRLTVVPGLRVMMRNNIVFSTDSRYAKYLGVLLYSLLDNTSRPLNFFVLYSSLDESSRHQLEFIVNYYKNTKKIACTIEFIHVDIEQKIKEHGLNVATFRGCFDPYTRLFVSEIFAGRDELDKLIYLDVDMLCKQDIAPLLDKAAQITTFAGVLDTVSIKLGYKLLTPHYINSGLLICSLSYLRELNFVDKAVSFIQEHQADLVCPDQDVINNVIPDGDLILLEQRFNEYLPGKQAVNNAVILHYTGPFKPWMKETRWRLKKVYWRAYQLYLSLLPHNLAQGPKTKKALFMFLACSRVFINIYMSLKKLFSRKK